MAGQRESKDGRADEGQEEPAITKEQLLLAPIVTGRIDELHITRKEIEKRSGVGVATLREMEHPRRPRVFGHKVLALISEALEWPSDHLVREIYPSSSEAPDRIVQGMMTKLAPYLEKIDAIPGLQEDVAAIKARLGITADPIHEVGDRAPVTIDDPPSVDDLPGRRAPEPKRGSGGRRQGSSPARQ
jgi:hypothetical protein